MTWIQTPDGTAFNLDNVTFISVEHPALPGQEWCLYAQFVGGSGLAFGEFESRESAIERRNAVIELSGP
jgi:hypothetical protein